MWFDLNRNDAFNFFILTKFFMYMKYLSRDFASVTIKKKNLFTQEHENYGMKEASNLWEFVEFLPSVMMEAVLFQEGMVQK